MDPQVGIKLSEEVLKNYQYCSTFKTYSIYILEEDVSFLIAIDKTNLVCGCFEFTETEDGMQLAHMNVITELKGQGIGKAILREAVDFWGSFELPSTNSSDTYYYIENGYNFILSCFNDGILSEPNFKNPDSNNYSENY
jgi:GNAT superfamily N-acetyltransferase